MDAKAAKAVLITDYLAAAGIEPVRVAGNDWWYRSPLREERTASFKVDAARNLWFDHGEGRGGTSIDLVMALFGTGSAGDAIRELSAFAGRAPSTGLRTPSKGALARPPSRAGAALLSAGAIRLDGPVARYLAAERGLPFAIAAEHAFEVRYEVAGGRVFEAAGFRNRSGGYEVRSPRFKGSVGKKDFSVVGVPRQGSPVRIFEGFADFLSALALWPEEADVPAVVLNSVSMAEAAARFVAAAGSLPRAYLDADPAGDAALARIRGTAGIAAVTDERPRYAGHKDINDFLLAGSHGQGTRKECRAERNPG
jgi:hypothetical protein